MLLSLRSTASLWQQLPTCCLVLLELLSSCPYRSPSPSRPPSLSFFSFLSHLISPFFTSPLSSFSAPLFLPVSPCLSPLSSSMSPPVSLPSFPFSLPPPHSKISLLSVCDICRKNWRNLVAFSSAPAHTHTYTCIIFIAYTQKMTWTTFLRQRIGALYYLAR